MNAFDNGKEENRLANLSSQIRILEPLTDFQQRHIRPPKYEFRTGSTPPTRSITAEILTQPFNPYLLKTSLIFSRSEAWLYRIGTIYFARTPISSSNIESIKKGLSYETVLKSFRSRHSDAA